MTAQEILDFWFGPLDEDGLADDAHNERFWRKDPEFDATVRARFGGLRAELLAGQHDDWQREPASQLAYVIVADQFSRNMFREDGRAFEADALALALARRAVEAGGDRTLRGTQRAFFYLPFMHSEALADQDECVRLFADFRDGSNGKLRDALEQNVGFAQKHRDIIARFGRFPHRNRLLGRASTPEELSFLQTPGSSF